MRRKSRIYRYADPTNTEVPNFAILAFCAGQEGYGSGGSCVKSDGLPPDYGLVVVECSSERKEPDCNRSVNYLRTNRMLCEVDPACGDRYVQPWII